MPPLRRSAVGAGAVAALLGAYGLGVLTPRGPSAAPARPAPALLDDAAARIAAKAATPVDRTALDKAAVQGMLSALGDRWASYYPPTDYASFADALEGRFTGVGLWLRAGAGHTLQVGSVTSGSPAARAGVRSGDTLATVDAHPVTTVPQAATLLHGPAGSPVRLQLRRGGRPVEVTLTRSQFVTDPVTTQTLAGGAILLRVDSFTRGVGRQIRTSVQAVTERPGHGGFVLDLRGNPGGLLDEAVEVASAFLDGGTVVTYDRRGDGERTLRAVGTADTATPLVVLVDGGTASAAEVVAGALQDRGRAVVVGARTYGKGSVQETQQLGDGSALELTVGHYRTPDGHDLDGHGITPDIEVAATAEAGVSERRAGEVLLGLRAALAGTPPA